MVGGALNVGDGGKPVASEGSSLYQLMSTYRDQDFPNSVKKGGGFLPQWRKSFLLGGGNLRSGFDSFSKLKTTFCQY